MADNALYHALVLSLHQPAGNLDHLLAYNPTEAAEILFTIDRIPRALKDYQDVARVHLAFSGTLLESLTQSDFQRRVNGVTDCEALLAQLRNTQVFDLLGTGYYHPVFPIVPPADWDAQTERWRGIAKHWFLNNAFQGFWPPEMGFCMDMIPLLQRRGYRYVIVDSEHVQAVTPMRWEEVRYRPHIARFGGAEIIVIVRDRELSNAQESGMALSWFQREVRERTRFCDFPALVTTCTDGENGGWFRNPAPESNFWDAFYRPLLDEARAGGENIAPIFIGDYLDRFGAYGEVTVGPGAWNTGWHDGHGFVQWAGTPAQKGALTRVGEISQAVQGALSNAAYIGSQNRDLLHLLEEAHWRVLRAETSCNFFWGDAWVMRCHADLDQACECLARASGYFSGC